MFGGIEGRYFLHNIYLDGSLFKDTHYVRNENFVHDLTAGFRFRFAWKALTLNYLYVRRS